MAATKKAEGHEPLFHIVKRPAVAWWRAWLIRIGAVIAALLVAGIVTLALTGENPISVYGTMIKSSFGTNRRVWQLLQNIAMLLCVALAVTPAFRMRFWNIGAEGQVLIGGLATAACMITLGGKVPDGVLILIMAVAAIVAGAIWGVIPAFFKANWGTNETLFTLMMNYVAMQLVQFFVVKWEVPKGSGKVGIINQSTEAGWLPQIGGYKYLLTILVVAVLTVLVYVYLNYSKHGYEISVVGESERTARYVGIKVGKVIVRTMLLSGALPQDQELDAVLEKASYGLEKRSGFVSSENYADEQQKKNDLYLLKAGSCFETQFEGDIYDVGCGGSHPVYRYAKALFVGV